MCDVEYVHEAEVATDADDVWHSTFVSLPQFVGAPAVQAAIDVDAYCRQTEGEGIDQCKNPQLEHPGEKTQIGEAEQDESADGRVVRRSEHCREDACYEKDLFH